MKKVFIDGSEGTTGLRIFERFEKRDDIELLKIPSELRKDPAEIRKYINASDVTFLCLPDAAAREAVTYVENDRVILIDTSTAHRTETGWAYGYPELSAAHREAVRNGKRIAVPGCHATGFITLIYPLVASGVMPKLNGKPSPEEIHQLYESHFAGERFVKVMPFGAEAETGNFLGSNNCSGWDGIQIFVTGNQERILVSSRFDNLGKGASGAAIQCLNLVLGCDEAKGLNL